MARCYTLSGAPIGAPCPPEITAGEFRPLLARCLEGSACAGFGRAPELALDEAHSTVRKTKKVIARLRSSASNWNRSRMSANGVRRGHKRTRVGTAGCFLSFLLQLVLAKGTQNINLFGK